MGDLKTSGGKILDFFDLKSKGCLGFLNFTLDPQQMMLCTFCDKTAKNWCLYLGSLTSDICVVCSIVKMLYLVGSVSVQVSASKNRVYLDAGALIINVGDKEFDENLESQLVRGKRK